MLFYNFKTNNGIIVDINATLCHIYIQLVIKDSSILFFINFFVTLCLFTLLFVHSIKDGEVREYTGEERTLKHLQRYIEEDQWSKVDPISWYKSPTSLQ